MVTTVANQHEPTTDADEATASVVRAVALGRTIDERPILQSIDLNISQGQFVVLLGANGAGKSTLLGVLSTLHPLTSGELHLFDHKVGLAGNAALRAKIGMIGHQAMLYRDLSALENLLFFGRLYGVKRCRDRAEELLAMVGLSHRADDAVKTFSRGMTQRVAIARALMHDPQLLLADEPFAGLDVRSMDTLCDLLGQLHAQGRTIIMANHDIAQSLQIADHVVVLRAGEVLIDAPTQGQTADAIRAEVAEG